jgi:uncharacterized protein YjbI with pentapeptide repeats
LAFLLQKGEDKMSSKPWLKKDMHNESLGKADLRWEDLSGFNFRSSNLTEADLVKAVCLKTDFRQANLSGADLREADLSTADLAGATLRGAMYDHTTIWPVGFDPESKGAKKILYW